MLEANDLIDNRPFLIEPVRRSCEGRDPRSEKLNPREEEQPGANAQRLMELSTQCSLLDASIKSYSDLCRTVFKPFEDGLPEQNGRTPTAVSANQPLFDRLAEITARLCHHQDFDLARDSEEQRTASGERREEQGEKTCNSLDLSRDAILGSGEFVHSRGSILATRDFTAERILASRSKVGIASSGTTGKPKWVHHRLDTLARSVKVTPNHRNDIWGLAYAPDRFAGMQVFLQAICNLNTIVTLLGLPPNDIHTAIDTYSITHLSATPTWFRMLLGDNIKHESVRSVTVGGEVCQPTLRTQLQRLFPNAKFRNIYASTEVGALFQSDSDTFVVTEDLQALVQVIDDQLWLHTSMIAESLRKNSVDDFFPTGDEVEIVQESPLTLRVLARRSDWINVGGFKVNPIAVENELMQIDGVKDARVFAKSNSVIGQVVACELIKHNDSNLTASNIRQTLLKRLPAYQVPASVSFVESFAATSSGKKVRHG